MKRNKWFKTGLGAGAVALVAAAGLAIASPTLAQGLAAYLNSTVVDEHFRRFSGHTQVNATDLRHLPYPSRDALEQLGHWVTKHPAASQAEIDHQIETLA